MHRRLLPGAWTLLAAALCGCEPGSGTGSPFLDVDAGEDQTIEEGEEATLSANVGGQTDGVTFRWELHAGFEMEIPEPASPQIEVGPFNVQGDYKFRVVAATADGRFGQDFVVVTVTAPGEDNENAEDNDNGEDNENAEPENENTAANENNNEPEPEEIVTRINAPLRIPLGVSTPLIASQPPNDLEATYQWAVIAGDATIEDRTERQTTITANDLADVTVRVTMTVPDLDQSYQDELTAAIDPQGTFGTHISGATETIAFQEVALASTSINVLTGTSLFHSWEVVEGEGEFADPLSRQTAFTPTAPGETVVQLTVTLDPGGEQSIDDYVIVVFPATEVEFEGQIENLVLLGQPTLLTVTAANFEDDDLGFEWRIVSGDAAIDDTTAREPRVTVSSLSTAELEVTASGVIDDLPRSGTYTVYATAVADLRVRVDISVEDVGTIPLELFGDAALGTVANFLHFVDDRHYDGHLFHRVLPDFIVQGGGTKLVDGQAEPVQAPRLPIPSEADNGLSNLRGTLSMALLSDQPDSGTQSFFINLSDDNVFLDEQQFTVFGQVLDTGMDVADAISTVETDANDAPVEFIVISSIRRVEEN